MLALKKCSEHCYVKHESIVQNPQGLCRIPNELLFEIFYFLNYSDLRLVSFVCRNWKSITQDGNFWKFHCEKNFFVKEHSWMMGKTWKAISRVLHGEIFNIPLETKVFQTTPDSNDPEGKRLINHLIDRSRVRDRDIAILERDKKNSYGPFFNFFIKENIPHKKFTTKTISFDYLEMPSLWDFQGHILVMAYCFTYAKCLRIWNLSIGKEILRQTIDWPKGELPFSLSIEGEVITIGCGKANANIRRISTLLRFSPPQKQENNKMDITV